MTATVARPWGLQSRDESLGKWLSIIITTACYSGPSWVQPVAIDGLQASLSWAGLYHFFKSSLRSFVAAGIAPEHPMEAIANEHIAPQPHLQFEGVIGGLRTKQ